MNFLELFKGNSSGGMLEKPGDRFEAFISKTNRKVMKLSKDGGKIKRSVTEYPGGTIVETLTRRKDG